MATGDGLIRVGELKSVLRACMEENGMKFSEEHLDDLTGALYEDANPEGTDGISFEQLKAQLEKHNGLLENMSIK
jgi:NADPH oxidase 5